MSKETKKELNDKQMSEVAGGYTFSQGGLRGFRYEVIDDGTGEVLGRYSSKEEALEMAKAKVHSVKELDWAELGALRDSAIKR